MNYQKILSLQKVEGITEMQNNINSGLCWKLEGSYGRAAMQYLEAGACMLPKVQRKDAYGNLVPSRDNLKKGTKGTYHNAVKYWSEYELNH